MNISKGFKRTAVVLSIPGGIVLALETWGEQASQNFGEFIGKPEFRQVYRRVYPAPLAGLDILWFRDLGRPSYSYLDGLMDHCWISISTLKHHYLQPHRIRAVCYPSKLVQRCNTLPDTRTVSQRTPSSFRGSSVGQQARTSSIGFFGARGR